MDIQLATDLERDNVFAEIFYEGQQWCEVYIDNESNEDMLHIIRGGDITVPLDEAVEAIKRAIERLRPKNW